MTSAPIEQQIELFEAHYTTLDTVYPHSCLWGDFNFCLDGIFEYEIQGQHHSLTCQLWGVDSPTYRTLLGRD